MNILLNSTGPQQVSVANGTNSSALLCVPLFIGTVATWRIGAWMGLILLGMAVRVWLLSTIDPDEQATQNVDALIRRVSWATFATSLAWGLGWFLVAFEMNR